MSPVIRNGTLECQTGQDLDHRSDNFPKIALDSVEAPQQRQLSWKRIDIISVEAEDQGLTVPVLLNSTEANDQYTSYLTSFTQELLNEGGSLRRHVERI
jgi:hypothetical protein